MGRRETAPAGRSSTSWSSACRASITPSSPRSTGTFPNHHPDPTVEANLEDLKRLVADKQLDFGIAFDGDGDRIGAVDSQGRVIWGDQLLMILAEPMLKELPGATIIADVKASQTLFDRIAAMGGTAVDVEDRAQPDQVEDEGNRCAAGRRDERPHLLQASLVRVRRRALCRDPADRGRVGSRASSLTEIKDAMPVSVATPEMRFQVDEVRKFAIVDEVPSGCPAMARRSTRPMACA